MSGTLTGKVAIITVAAGGIGTAYCRRLAELGATQGRRRRHLHLG
jgi:NAD(P)-dependent dehydrogenase (short-subunit alcohol dehydrogenase family)